MKRLKLHLIGAVTLTASDGSDLTPTSKFARAILAILAVSRHHQATRAKLQGLLWSRNTSESAQNNLRVCLSGLRRSLGAERAGLISRNGLLQLDTNVFEIILTLPPGPRLIASMPEFAEDLDIPDPEFEDWIRDIRQHYEQLWLAPPPDLTPAPPERQTLRQLRIITDRTGRSEDNALCHMIAFEAAKRAAAYSMIDIVEDQSQSRTGALTLDCKVIRFQKSLLFQVIVRMHSTGEPLWSQTLRCTEDEITAKTQDFSASVSVAILSIANKVTNRSDTALRLPLGDVFSFNLERLHSAEASLLRLDPNQSNANILSLRAFIRHTLLMERMVGSPADMIAEASDLARRAMAIQPQESPVLAVASLFAGIRGEDDVALDLAQRAERIDPANSFSRHAYSVALSFAGKPLEAFRQSFISRQGHMAMIAPALYHLRCAYAALGVGKQHEALKLAKMARDFAPDLRAAQRVVSALAYELGDIETARDSLWKLKELEPDFSLDLMASDAYPVDTLRRSGALSLVRSDLLIA